MHYVEVAPLSLVRTDAEFFTYATSLELEMGRLVKIPVGKKTLTGIVLSSAQKPSYETKEIISTYDLPAIPKSLIFAMRDLTKYYGSHLSSGLQMLVPKGLDKTRRMQKTATSTSVRERTNFLLNDSQRLALEQINKASPGTVILHGITGSGKTAVYKELAKSCVDAGQSVVILVPEIALTSQLVDEMQHEFSNVIVNHSKQTEAARHLSWQKALTSTEPIVAIGPRSTMFLPLPNLGIIIIDEAHEPSYKQEQTPRYSALRAASIISKYAKIKVIQGSATPLVSEYYLAEKANRPIVSIPEKARQDTTPPEVTLVDMTKRTNFSRHQFLSTPLLKQIDKSIAAKEQILLFHNRRGTAGSTLCENCGWLATCPRCFIPFTLHSDQHILRCHICGQTAEIPKVCPECGQPDVIHKGLGTKRIESEVRKLYPHSNIARFDGDTAADATVEQLYGDIYAGKIDILIGTQVLAKGLDLPKLRTVGVVQADAGLNMPDYMASERTFQLLCQVIGRVGRSHHETAVIIQSFQPSSQAVQFGISQDYAGFYEYCLTERKRAHFPPFTHLLQLTCVYKTEAAAVRNASKLARELRQKYAKHLVVFGPAPAFYERQRDTYRWQILLKSPTRSVLEEIARNIPKGNWQVELDPMSLL